MSELEKFISSGILESFVLGDISHEDHAELKRMTAKYPQLLEELTEIEMAVKAYIFSYSLDMPTIDILGGESDVPRLAEKQSLEFWQDITQDFQCPQNLESIHMEEIAQNEEMATFVVWVDDQVPEEVHTDIYEHIFILEGTCDCMMDGKVIHMFPGDYMAIPLHAAHRFTVTSKTPLKAILQESKVA